MKLKLNWDKFGMVTTVACAIHCGVLPFILPALSLFGVGIVHNAYLEWGMILLAFFIGMYSLYHGYINHHHSPVPGIIFIAGFLSLLAKQIFIEYHFVFLIVAVVSIIVAHYLNFQFCKRSKCSSHHHEHT